MLSGQKTKPAPAKMPPVPSKAALAEAQSKGQAALGANKQNPAKQVAWRVLFMVVMSHTLLPAEYESVLSAYSCSTEIT